jgi:hypothetical protein
MRSLNERPMQFAYYVVATYPRNMSALDRAPSIARYSGMTARRTAARVTALGRNGSFGRGQASIAYENPADALLIPATRSVCAGAICAALSAYSLRNGLIARLQSG